MAKKLIIAFLVLVLAVALIGGYWVYNRLSALEQPVELDSPQLYTVDKGSSYGRVALELERLGMVEDALWLRVYARLQLEPVTLRSGTYEVLPGMSPLDIIRMIAAGQTKYWTLQLIEGWSFAEVRASLQDHEHLEHTLPHMSNEELMEELGRAGIHPEGLFFPDTYRYHAGDSDVLVLRRALERLEKVLAEEWENRAEGLPYESSYEALIMASLVEKETGAPFERPEIAGVFIRRLEKGMRLQTDPAVIYGLGERYTGNLTRKHLREDNPYNTYRRSGLPPTPISLVGRAAIHAALHPADGESLYFVARGDGTHVFSKTLEEHRKAVQHFQVRNRTEDYRSSPAPAREGAGQ